MPPNQANQREMNPEHRSRFTNLVASLCGPALLLLALWFVFGASTTAPVPTAPAPVIPASDINPAPRFTIMTDPPSTVIGGKVQRCNDCHSLVDLSRNNGQPLVQHTNITLNHGRNDRCLNCHDRKDRGRLVGPHGKNLPYADVAELCAQCHGSIFNDWRLGTHGKTLGYWDSDLGESRRLVCTECHDPHAPAYKPMRPLPGPNTLRMGPPDKQFPEHMTEELNPLLRWRSDENAADRDRDATDGGDH